MGNSDRPNTECDDAREPVLRKASVDIMVPTVRGLIIRIGDGPLIKILAAVGLKVPLSIVGLNPAPESLIILQ
jgi:hypothetical protein